MSAAERERYAELCFPKRRKEWLLGRWTAKQLLRASRPAYRDIPLSAITVDNDPDGAPYLAVDREGRLPLSISISHRGEHAFCALATSQTIGADLEHIESRAPAFVRDFFTAGELARVQTCPPASRDTLITTIWSAKEAVLKVLRTGLRVDTRRVEIAHLDELESSMKNQPMPEVHLVRVGGGTNNDLCQAHGTSPTDIDVAWHRVRVRCTLPGTPRFLAWWRPHGAYVLTLATAHHDRANSRAP